MNTPKILQLSLSKEIVSFLEFTKLGEIVSLETFPDTKTDVLEIDIEAIELPQYPLVAVKNIERIVIKVTNNMLPDVFCRSDFPVVPHLNLLENGDKTLCLYDVPFQEIKYMFNASVLINRIIYWFSKTARGELHQPDQYLEPFFPSVCDVVILNRNNDKSKIPFIRLEEIRTQHGHLLSEIPLDETMRGKLFACLNIDISKIYSDNIINDFPNTLFDLDAAFNDNILQSVDSCILPIWAIKQKEKEYNRLFDQTESVLKNCSVIIFVKVLLARTPESDPEQFDCKGFTIQATFEELYRAFGYKKRGTKLERICDHIEANKLLITQHEVHWHLSREFAQILNDVRGYDCENNFIQIGVGTLGSQIANNCIRSGFGKWTFIEPDIVYPHNLSRHCLNSSYIGQNKAVALNSYIESIFTDKLDSCENTIIDSNVLSLEFKDRFIEVVDSSKMIVDTSASIAVARYVCHEIAGTTRCVSFFMNPTGSCVIMLLEDEDRKIPLDVLEMQYYNTLIKNQKYHDHLKSDWRVVYSSSCRGKSLKYSQDNAAIFSGLCSKAIKEATINPNALIAIWEADKLAIVSEFYHTCEYKSIIVKDWTVKISLDVEQQLYEIRKEKLPFETGGILIGSYDFEHKICYVVTFIKSPDDSVASPTSFIRGSKGILDEINNIESITAGNLGYIGEWHSHPNNCTQQSRDDRILMQSIVEYTLTQGCPGCMIIVGEDNLSVHIKNGYNSIHKQM